MPSTRKASEAVRAGAGADTINAVVVMTDGKNEYPDDNDLDGLVRQLGDQALEGGVRVFTIAYGEDADLDSRQAHLRGVSRRRVRRDRPADDRRGIHQRPVELLMAATVLGRGCWRARATRGHCCFRRSAAAWRGRSARPSRCRSAPPRVMLGTAATVGAFTRPREEAPAQLRPGTRQQGLIILLDGHVRSLRALQTEALPDVVQTKAEDALAAADAARPSVLQMASAVDALDDAIAAAREVSGQGEHAIESIKKTVARLRSRRAALFERLTAAVDEVATVYAGLLEVSATARTMGVSLDDTEVGAVNDAVTLLQMTFAELEADAANLPSEDLYH